ncbi:MAG TPA: Ig-like domain-containing protein [Gemmatimonadales bacterium]|nr:Ig-like domain-containing protein [Gemmatimonadales bacterium]
MPDLTTPSARRMFVVLLAGTLGCGSDLLLPDSGGSGESFLEITRVTSAELSGPVGEPLQPLIVKVLGADDQPAVGVEVAFELSDAAAGIVDPPSTTTNSQGEAVAHWTLGSVPGSYKAVARLVGAGTEAAALEFTAQASPGQPDTLSSQIPLDQPGRRQQQVEDAPRVRVVDRFGNPVPNVPVAWQVISGEGTVANPITNTDAQGEATVEWTLGNRIGVHKLTAAIGSVTGSPITFTAVVYF